MNKDEGKYRPVSCTTYSAYELAIMHRQPLRLAWEGAAGEHHIGMLLPVDLETCRGEEFLIARHGGQMLRLRLDRIISSRAG